MKNEIKIYIGITILLVADLILYLTNGISFAGNIIDRLIFWIWFIGTFYIVFKYVRKKWAKIYGMTLVGLTVLSFFPMGAPILTITAFAITNENSQKIDNEIRIFETAKSVIGRPYISVVRNYWIFEKEVGGMDYDFEINDEYYNLKDSKSIKRLPDSEDGKVRLEFEFENGKIIKTAHNNV
ncbi:hypothetical protein [Flagellimonas meishanensis]|uniref:hypothetical protein n=1 Tax=Flagellimonas meishanensis TaxID=2873264 RepID=UPI001CA60A3A|nr:hypothetical protein [[Muricauda] meishanensis]